jgi:hypothetical protein
MSRFCPSCGTDVQAGFSRCPTCNFDFNAQPRDGGLAGPGQGSPAPQPTTGDDWGKTVVEPAAPRPEAGRRARFDRAREFYEPLDETRSGQFRPGETAISGETVAGDQTIVERSRPSEVDDATVIIRSGRRGVTGPLAYLVERNGVRAGKVHLLRTETSIGRGPDNDIALGDDSVSRRHAKIRLEEGAFVYWDLASANYSYLVGADGSRARILEPRRLADGDKIDLGDARVTFILVDDGGESGDAS